MRWTILHTESSDGWGGQEVRILLEAIEFSKRGHDVFIACNPGSGIEKKALKEGIKVFAINMKKIFNINSINMLVRLIKEKKINIVNTHSSVDSWIASFSARIVNVPVLLRTRHVSVPISNHILNLVYKFPDKIITTGESIRREMILKNKFEPSKIVTIPTGVYLDKFNPEIVNGIEVKKELLLDNTMPVISKIAVLRSWKRHDVFIDAIPGVIKHFPDSKFLIVGEGPMRNVIEEKIEKMKIQSSVVLTGYREDIPEILSISDIVVLTSDANEGIPQSLIQALAMQRPVISTNIVSIAELIRDEHNGILIPPGDSIALSEKICMLLRDKELCKKIGKNGRELIEKNYNTNKMIESIEELYINTFKNKGGRYGD